MSVTRPVKLSTYNERLEKDIEVTFEITVPEDLAEAIELFDGEEKLMESIQSNVQQRKLNAARPVLRDADTEQDWATVAEQVAESYAPGRRGGFGPVELSKDDIANAESSEDILALLASKGVRLV